MSQFLRKAKLWQQNKDMSDNDMVGSGAIDKKYMGALESNVVEDIFRIGQKQEWQG